LILRIDSARLKKSYELTTREGNVGRRRRRWEDSLRDGKGLKKTYFEVDDDDEIKKSL
jgi:hypothetical protein